MDEVKQILADVQKGVAKPIYFLMGDEPYYIDYIAGFIEEHVLQESERAFNQLILYGRDVSVEEIIAHARRYPMMAERQVIVVREAQELHRTIENLTAYVEKPQPTTVLVCCYKYKTLDKRKKLYKTVLQNGLVYESKKLYENQVMEWVKKTLAAKRYEISYKAAQMLVEFLGTDLGKIHQELTKLQTLLPQGSEITPQAIEENIGISKDYNNFELRKAIAERDVVKAARIINYFAHNPKDNPLVVTLSLLFQFFSQVLRYHGLNDHSPRHVAASLGINPYFVGEYQAAAKHYSMKKASDVIARLRDIDVRSKGVGASALPQEELFKELLVGILY